MITQAGIMILDTQTSLSKRAIALLCPVVVLSACAGAKTDYPSFAIPQYDETSNRVSLKFPGVTGPEPIDPASVVEPVSDNLDAQVARLTAKALDSVAEFERELGSVRQLAKAASGASQTSDAWGTAQIRLADLTSHHSEARLALAELDLLAANARIAVAPADSLAAIGRAQAKLGASLESQDSALASLVALLDR